MVWPGASKVALFQGARIRMLRHAAEPGHTRHDQPAPTKAGTTKNQGDTNRPSIVPRNARLPAPICTCRCSSIGWRRSVTTGSPAFFQASRPPVDDEGLAGAADLAGEPRGVALRACAAAAMKDDRLAFVQREVGLVELGERQMMRPGELLAGVLIRLADIDQDGPVIEQALGVGGTDFRQRHD